MKRKTEKKATLKKQQNKIKDATRGEDPYSAQLNGNASRAPPWPTPHLSNEKMFLLPKKLELEDKITINCETLNQPSVLRFGLVTEYNNLPDYNNLACQVELFITSDRVVITRIKDGVTTTVQEETDGGYYEDINFEMEFKVRDSGMMNISIKGNIIGTIELLHNVESIRFLTVNGDVSKVKGLVFEFGE